MEFRATRRIPLPADEVFAFVADGTNEPLWLDQDEPFVHVGVEHVGGPELGLGARYVRVNTFGDKRFEAPFEVVAFEPGRLVAYGEAGDTHTTFLLEPVADATDLTCVSANRTGWAGVLARVTPRRRYEAQIRAELEAIERALRSR